jgi:TIR domain/Ras family
MSNRVVRVVSAAKEEQVVILEGLLDDPRYVRFSPDAQFVAATTGNQLLLWRCQDWVPVAQNPPWAGGGAFEFHPTKPLLIVANPVHGQIDCYWLDYARLRAEVQLDSRRYVNAKVVLLGDTGVGKSGLGLVLSGQPYRPTDSTHGRNVWIFDSHDIEKANGGIQTREVLLWDLAGQPGYRLIHQLHLGEVAAALIVFDSRSETDPFSGIKHWVRALAQARQLEGPAAVPVKSYLVAARADRGGVAVTRERIQGMVEDFGLDGFFETSAKEGWKVSDLAQTIRDGIDWDSLPMVSSNALFQAIKLFLLEEKKQGHLLSTAADLFGAFRRSYPDAASQSDLRASFDACVGRVESRGLITRLHFGDLVLLQPELLDAYASAMVQAAKEEPDGLGFIPEEEAVTGRFRLAESERVPDRKQEKLLLIATVEELLRHEIALREVTDRGVDLIFPSQFTREQPDAPDIPGKQVVLTFEGPLRSIYASLAVRLSHSTLFRRKAMWQNAAAYTAIDGGTCGIHMRELDEGRGEFTLFYDSVAGHVVRAQFETYVMDYLELRALPGTVVRRPIRTCPDPTCGYVLPDDLVRRKLELGGTTLPCPLCEQAVVSLTDDEPPTAATATDTAVAEMNRNADIRRDQNVAATQLQGKIQTSDFDVFFCYNSKDRDQVQAIGERLKEIGILPWLDIWEIPPGTQWQSELRKQIKSIKSAAVFLGPGGSGPWQVLEVQAILNELTKRKRPIIPVILDGRNGKPRFPDFLNLWHVVDMRKQHPDPFGQLVWGITGQRPIDA